MRRLIHNVIAHPLVVLWPRVGEWLHERTAPEDFCSVCGGVDHSKEWKHDG